MTAQGSFPRHACGGCFASWASRTSLSWTADFPSGQRRAGKSTDAPPIMRDRHITISRQNQLVRDVTQVAAASKLEDHEILDARSTGRFRGEEPEPREGLRSGHIPGSTCVHYRALLNDDGTMKSVSELKAVFENAGADLSRPVITTCGSGVTAAILNLGLERLGHRQHALYDGSWGRMGHVWRPESGHGMSVQKAGTKISYTITHLEMESRPDYGWPRLPPTSSSAALLKSENPPVWWFLDSL